MMSASDGDLNNSIESCEVWEWWGGGVVLVGVIAQIVIAALHPPYDSFWEQWGAAIADSLVAIGVGTEIKFGQMAGLRQSELKRRSDEAIGEANRIAAQAVKEAADARERTAEVEKLTAWRRVTAGIRERISAGFAAKAAILILAIEYEIGDTKAFSFAREILQVFKDLGVKEIAFRSNSHLLQTVFGVTVWVGVGKETEEISALCMTAFGFVPKSRDLKQHAGEEKPTPNLYLFVGPKPPPELSVDLRE